MRTLKLSFLLLVLWTPLLAESAGTPKYWIYFRDRGPVAFSKNAVQQAAAREALSERALERRRKHGLGAELLEGDAPVDENYIRSLEQFGVTPIIRSRWLNAISARLTRDELDQVRALPFVDRIEPVYRLQPPPAKDRQHASDRPAALQKSATSLNYGPSLAQNSQIRVPVLHDAGITGEGVIVGLLDSGFWYSVHPALSRVQVEGEFDFVFDDGVVENEPEDVASAHNHGTQVLGAIGGFAPGSLIGPAYDAKYFLAKTEDIRSETPVEEDNWLAAAEWMEQQGVDVISSSLSYTTFDDPSASYTYEQMDGRTAVVTLAAQAAADRGVAVFVSAGNDGGTSRPHIGAPADGIDVMAVGAVDFSDARVGFSSIGPTADGRIKPDLMARGRDVFTVDGRRGTGYVQISGTSFSCPLTAGVAAQVLSAHPQLTNLQLYEALKMTAGRATRPDNEFGYGIIDAHRAATYWGPAFSNRVSVGAGPGGGAIVSVRCLPAPGETVQAMTLFWRLPGGDTFTETGMQQLDSTLFSSTELAVAGSQQLEVWLRADVGARGVFMHPADAPAGFEITGIEEGSGDFGDQTPGDFALLQSYPNPFFASRHGFTRIRMQIKRSANVTVSIYNVLGREVARFTEERLIPPGTINRDWSGRGADGTFVSAGVYLYRVFARFDDGSSASALGKLLIVN